jgi:hypothetical protein
VKGIDDATKNVISSLYGIAGIYKKYYNEFYNSLDTEAMNLLKKAYEDLQLGNFKLNALETHTN